MGTLAQAGYEITNDADQADTVVVNTCGFIESAKQESIDAILEATRLKAEGHASRVIVAGCLVERYRDDLLAELPEVDAFIGTSQVGEILKARTRDSARRSSARRAFAPGSSVPIVIRYSNAAPSSVAR